MTGHVAMRTCVVCREKRPKTALLRLALMEQQIIEDPKHVLPGRGAYVCQRQDCMRQLQFDKRLQRAFRGKAKQIVQDVGLRLLAEEPQQDE